MIHPRRLLAGWLATMALLMPLLPAATIAAAGADLELALAPHVAGSRVVHVAVTNHGSSAAPASSLTIETLAPGSDKGSGAATVQVPALSAGGKFVADYTLDETCVPSGVRLRAMLSVPGAGAAVAPLVAYPCLADLHLTYAGQATDQSLQFRIENLQISRTTLTFDEQPYWWTKADGSVRTVRGCVAVLGLATSDWFAGNPPDGLFPNETIVDLSPWPSDRPDFNGHEFDVTGWLQASFVPAPGLGVPVLSPSTLGRDGFVLRGAIEDLHGDDETSCMSSVSNVQLHVTTTRQIRASPRANRQQGDSYAPHLALGRVRQSAAGAGRRRHARRRPGCRTVSVCQ
jgi:hypothetical protein